MKKLILSEFITLDGIIEDPSWTWQFHTEEQEKYKFNELKECDALLLGRTTYEGFAEAWPKMIEQTGEYGLMMNSYPKYVASSTLEKLEWNNSKRIEGDLVEGVTKLKQEQGRSIIIFGSCKLAQSLMDHDLIDEYRLMVFPIVVGKGQRLFKEGISQKTMKLVDSETFSTGVMAQTYQPVR